MSAVVDRRRTKWPLRQPECRVSVSPPSESPSPLSSLSVSLMHLKETAGDWRKRSANTLMSASTGIGASIAPSAAGGFEVLSLSATGNASQHLVVGDRILSIGAVATTGLSDAAVKALILGPAGSTISMVGPLHNAETTAEVSYTFTCSFSFFLLRWWFVELSTSPFLSAATPLLFPLQPLPRLQLPHPPQLPTKLPSRPQLLPAARDPPSA